MASVLPHHPPVDHVPSEQTDVVIDTDEPTDVLQVLSSETAQKILSTLRDEPGTASDIAGDIDGSLQNVVYHLDRLCGADLVTPAETWYSEKGKEMTVYALATERVVIRFGTDADPIAGSRQ